MGPGLYFRATHVRAGICYGTGATAVIVFRQLRRVATLVSSRNPLIILAPLLIVKALEADLQPYCNFNGLAPISVTFRG